MTIRSLTRDVNDIPSVSHSGPQRQICGAAP